MQTESLKRTTLRDTNPNVSVPVPLALLHMARAAVVGTSRLLQIFVKVLSTCIKIPKNLKYGDSRF